MKEGASTEPMQIVKIEDPLDHITPGVAHVMARMSVNGERIWQNDAEFSIKGQQLVASLVDMLASHGWVEMHEQKPGRIWRHFSAKYRPKRWTWTITEQGKSALNAWVEREKKRGTEVGKQIEAYELAQAA